MSKRPRVDADIDVELVAAIEQRAAKLSSARVRGGDDSDELMRYLLQSHRSDVVRLVNARLSVSDAKRLAAFVGFPPESEEGTRPVLKVVHFQIYGQSRHFEHLWPVLAGNRTTLRHVDLARNRLSSDDVPSIINALQLQHNTSLEVLNVSFNDIGDAGLILLMNAAMNNTTLQALICKHCHITCAGAEGASNYLQLKLKPISREDDTVRPNECSKFFLSLNNNCIGPRGLMALRRPLPEHVSLTVAAQVKRPQGRISSASPELPHR